MLTNKEYKEALLVQDACNLSGVVFSFSRIMEKICEEQNELGQGTDYKNLHPIAVLFASKIASLTQCENGINFSKAWDTCREKGK